MLRMFDRPKGAPGFGRSPTRYSSTPPPLTISKSAPPAPGRQQTPGSRFKDFEGAAIRNRNHDHPAVVPGYVSSADRARFQANRGPLGSVAWRDGEFWFDPEGRFNPAREQALNLRAQFARTRGRPGVRPGLQARVASAVEDPKALAFLDVLGLAEGGNTWRNRGGLPWNSRFDDRPDRRLTFDFSRYPTKGPGRFKGLQQTAAGRYQIQRVLYGEMAPRLGISDFSPISQNAIALGTMAERDGMLDSLQNGNIAKAFDDASVYWASLPRGPATVSARDEGRYSDQGGPFTYDELLAYYKKRLNYYEGGNPRGRVVDDPVAFRR